MITTLVQNCVACNNREIIQVDEDALEDYCSGDLLVQEAFPNLTDAQRELFFLSHLCGTCWDQLIVDFD